MKKKILFVSAFIMMLLSFAALATLAQEDDASVTSIEVERETAPDL